MTHPLGWKTWGTNNNANYILEEDRCQFVNDLTFLEIVNLVNIGISSHNTKQQLLNDFPTPTRLWSECGGLTLKVSGVLGQNQFLVQKSGNDC